MYKLPRPLMVLTIEFFIEDFWVHQCWNILHEKDNGSQRDGVSTLYSFLKQGF
jgi:hypothetical protein